MLVDRDGFELVLADGYVAGEGCDVQCCGCGWYRVRECSPQAQACGGGGGGPDSRIGYVWSCIGCVGGGQLQVGNTFLWLGVCWTVLDVPPVPMPPQGALVRMDTTPVVCTNGCGDPRCPQGDAGVYYVATPCVADGTYPTVYVCFDGTCTTFNIQVMRTLPGGGQTLAAMCYVARRSSSVPADQLPPNAQTFDLRGVTGFRTCCECIAAGRVGDTSCAIGQLWNGQTGGCWPDEDQALTPCCCGLDSGGDFSGRLRVDRFDVVQEVGYNGGGGTRFLITRTIESVTLDAEGCPILHILEHFIDNATGVEGESRWDITQADGILPSCRNCGWGVVPVNYPRQGALVGGPGQTWGVDCEGFNVDANGQPIDPQYPSCTASWSLTVECDRVLLVAAYVYFDPASNQTILTTFTTEMHYQYATEDERCNGGCNSAGVRLDRQGDGWEGGWEGGMDGVVSTTAGKAGVKKGASGVRDGFRGLIRV